MGTYYISDAMLEMRYNAPEQSCRFGKKSNLCSLWNFTDILFFTAPKNVIDHMYQCNFEFGFFFYQFVRHAANSFTNTS